MSLLKKCVIVYSMLILESSLCSTNIIIMKSVFSGLPKRRQEKDRKLSKPLRTASEPVNKLLNKLKYARATNVRKNTSSGIIYLLFISTR